MEKKILFNTLNNFLCKINFKKHGTLWGKVCDEYLLIIHLRKSQWNNKYYLDLGGICSHDEFNNFSKKTKDIDFVISVEKLVPELDSFTLDSALDLDISDEIKLDKLLDILNKHLIPYINKMSTKEGIKELYNDGGLKAAMIDAKARKILSI